MFIELKAVYRNIRQGFDNNLTDYMTEQVIPHAFYHNAFLIVSNGDRARYGSINSKWEHYRVATVPAAEMEVAVDVHRQPIRTLELALVERAHPELGRLGVFWHTQGSGKSHSMAFFAQKVRRVVPGNFIGWVYLAQRRERARQRQQLLDQQRINEADKLRLEEELRRQEAERKHQEAERQNLELKSQLFANIGIMAGSYAHNIKNLLVRPNDLLRRCLEEEPPDQAHLLREVKQTLGTVTERLQQILQTVRRDPSKVERVRLDLNALAQDMYKTWVDLGLEKWKLVIELDRAPEPLWIEGDASHLQQALENLLFNARDATFEMRNYLREQARQPGAGGNLDTERRQALIAAAGWKGKVVLRTRRAGDRVLLEVVDNGIGMTEEVRRRCRETHFSTKRNNALFAGISAGMGLGLSFVSVILEHHQATLEIESEPLRGATFRVLFPAAANS